MKKNRILDLDDNLDILYERVKKNFGLHMFDIGGYLPSIRLDRNDSNVEEAYIVFQSPSFSGNRQWVCITNKI